MDKHISLGNHLLHGINHFGQWVTEATEGWDEPPAIRDTDVERESAHGSYDLPSYYAARTPTLDGILVADSRAQALQALQTLNANASLGLQTLAITDAGKTQWARVKLVGLDHSWVTNKAFRWQLRVKAPDPRKYGESNVFTGSSYQDVALWHRGNYPAFPEVTITAGSAGLPSGISLAGPGGELFRLTRNIPAGDSFTVNMAEGFARFYGGTPVTGGYGRMDAWTVPPGGESTIRLGADGTGTIRVTVKDTYI